MTPRICWCIPSGKYWVSKFLCRILQTCSRTPLFGSTIFARTPAFPRSAVDPPRQPWVCSASHWFLYFWFSWVPWCVWVHTLVAWSLSHIVPVWSLFAPRRIPWRSESNWSSAPKFLCSLSSTGPRTWRWSCSFRICMSQSGPFALGFPLGVRWVFRGSSRSCFWSCRLAGWWSFWGLRFRPEWWVDYLESLRELPQLGIFVLEGLFPVDLLSEFLDLHLVGVAVEVVALDLPEPAILIKPYLSLY